MHQFIVLLLVLLLFWYVTPAPRPPVMLAGIEPYRNEPSAIQFTNAEFKFYK